MAKANTTPKTDKELLDKTMKRFNDSWDYAKGTWHRCWERDWKLYNNQRVRASYEGITDTFVPMAFSTIETMVAALGNGRPRFDYQCSDPTKQTKTDSLNALVDEYWEADQWDVKIVEGIRQELKVGTAPNILYWDINRPRLLAFSIRDAIVDPTARSQEDLHQPGSYAGRRYFVRKGTLDDFEVVDTDETSKTYGQLIKRFKNTKDSDNPTSESSADDDKHNKEMFLGSTLGTTAAEDQDELIEIWDVDRVVTVRNRHTIIENIENPYKAKHRLILTRQYAADLQTPEEIAEAQKRAASEAKGLVPFFFFRNYTDESLFYGKSEIEPIAPLQENLNDMRNQETDFIIKQLAPQKELDPAYEDWLDLIDNDPDTVYPFKPGSLTNIAPPALPPNSFQEQINIKNEIRETTAIDQVAKGVANVKDATATEVKAQLNQAGQRIEIKARMLEKDGFYWMAKILFRMIQLYVDKPLVVKVTGTSSLTEDAPSVAGIQLPKGTAIFDPADYTGDWEPHVMLEISSQNQKQERQQAATQAYQVLIKDPTNNLQEIKKRLLPKMFDLDKEDLDAILTSPTGAGVVPGLPADPLASPGLPGSPAASLPAGLPEEVPNAA